MILTYRITKFKSSVKFLRTKYKVIDLYLVHTSLPYDIKAPFVWQNDWASVQSLVPDGSHLANDGANYVPFA